ncbi:MAG: hypothetical protein ABFE02_03940 [Sulfuricella sp.]
MTKVFQQRARTDRRKIECDPPKGWKDRRRTVERRMPVVVELSFEECVALMCQMPFRRFKENNLLADYQLDPFASTTKNAP